MRSLLDVNVIIALIDPEHTLQDRAHQWWMLNRKHGWASCPLTENGAVRIMSNPNYRQNTKFTPGGMIVSIKDFAERTDHEFWSDDISIIDEKIFVPGLIHSPKQITDLYLLALATKHNARLVTFDQNIPLSAVIGAKVNNLYVI